MRGTVGHLRPLVTLIAVVLLTGCSDKSTPTLTSTPPPAETAAASPSPALSPTGSPSPFVTGTPTRGASPAAGAVRTATPVAALAGAKRYTVDSTSPPRQGIVLQVRALEQAGTKVRVHAAFTNRDAELKAFTGSLGRGDAVALRAGTGTIRPASVSENFRDDVCPDRPARSGCTWLPGAVERGWFDFEVPAGTSAPYTLNVPGYGETRLTTDSALNGDLWPSAPPFPKGAWTFDQPYRVAHEKISSLRLSLQKIETRDDGLYVTAEVRRPDGLQIIGTLPSGAELGYVDASGHQAFPSTVPEVWRISVEPKDDKTRVSAELVYPTPTGRGPLVFGLRGWPLMQFDPTTRAVSPVTYDGTAFRPAPPSAASASDQAQAEVNVLLGGMAGELRRADGAAVKGHFAGDAKVDRAELDKVVTLGGWPVADIRLQVANARAGQADRLDGADIEMSVRLEGMGDTDRLRYDATASFRKDAAGWVITAWDWDRAPEWVPLPGRPVSSDHFLLIAPARLGDADARAALADLEDAYTRLQTRLPKELFRARYMALYAPDTSTFGTLTGRSSRDVLGAALSQVSVRYEDEEPVGFEVSGVRIILNAEGVKAAGTNDPIYGRAATLRHELAHAVLSGWSRGWTPDWLTEGAALWAADQPVWQGFTEPAAGLTLGPFLTSTTFRELGDISGERESRGYRLASALATFTVEKYGLDRFLKLYQAYAGVPVATVRKHAPLVRSSILQDAANDDIAVEVTPGFLSQNLGVTDSAAFEAEFKSWLAGRQR